MNVFAVLVLFLSCMGNTFGKWLWRTPTPELEKKLVEMVKTAVDDWSCWWCSVDSRNRNNYQGGSEVRQVGINGANRAIVLRTTVSVNDEYPDGLRYFGVWFTRHVQKKEGSVQELNKPEDVSQSSVKRQETSGSVIGEAQWEGYTKANEIRELRFTPRFPEIETVLKHITDPVKSGALAIATNLPVLILTNIFVPGVSVPAGWAIAKELAPRTLKLNRSHRERTANDNNDSKVEVNDRKSLLD